MKKILEPLSHVPGVRRAMLISNDGVPIVSVSNRADREQGEESAGWVDSSEDANAFAGLAISWVAEVQRSVDPMSWNSPGRLVLRAARGSLVLLCSERAMLAVELERGMAPEELRLPMEAALARMQRTLRRTSKAAASGESPEIQGIFPGQATAEADGELSTTQVEEHVSVENTGMANEEMRGASLGNESDCATGTERNETTGNEVP